MAPARASGPQNYVGVFPTSNQLLPNDTFITICTYNTSGLSRTDSVSYVRSGLGPNDEVGWLLRCRGSRGLDARPRPSCEPRSSVCPPQFQAASAALPAPARGAPSKLHHADARLPLPAFLLCACRTVNRSTPPQAPPHHVLCAFFFPRSPCAHRVACRTRSAPPKFSRFPPSLSPLPCPPSADLLQLRVVLSAILHAQPGLLRGGHTRQHLHMLYAHQAGSHGERNAPAASGGEHRPMGSSGPARPPPATAFTGLRQAPPQVDLLLILQ